MILEVENCSCGGTVGGTHNTIYHGTVLCENDRLSGKVHAVRKLWPIPTFQVSIKSESTTVFSASFGLKADISLHTFYWGNTLFRQNLSNRRAENPNPQTLR